MTRLALAFLIASFAPGCATDSTADNYDVAAAPGDNGKFDSAAGKQLRFHNMEQLEALYNASDMQWGDLAHEQTMTINVNTASETVVSGAAWGFQAPLSWPDHTILKLATRPGTSDAMTEIAFVAFVPKGQTDYVPLACGGVNMFDSIAIDPDQRQVHTNNKTYEFAECGFDKGTPGLILIPVPMPTTGPSEGPFKYHLDVTAE